MAGKQEVRVSVKDIRKMLDIIATSGQISYENEDKMNVLITYESVAGIGANLELTIEDVNLNGHKARVVYPIIGVEDW